MHEALGVENKQLTEQKETKKHTDPQVELSPVPRVPGLDTDIPCEFYPSLVPCAAPSDPDQDYHDGWTDGWMARS